MSENEATKGLVPDVPAARTLDSFVKKPEAPKPATMAEAFQNTMKKDPIVEGKMSAEELAALEGKTAPEEDAEAPVAEAPNAIPEWVVMPVDPKWSVPAGRQVIFVRFRAAWTDAPAKGDRQCIIWSLTDTDEKLALKRTAGDSTRMLAELSKQMIRVVDGEPVNWTRGSLSNVERFWHEIGAKCRAQVSAIYHKTHTLNREETMDFFANCVNVMSGVG